MFGFFEWQGAVWRHLLSLLTNQLKWQSAAYIHNEATCVAASRHVHSKTLRGSLKKLRAWLKRSCWGHCKMPAWACNEMRFSKAEPRLHKDWGATLLHHRCRKRSSGSVSEVCQPDGHMQLAAVIPCLLQSGCARRVVYKNPGILTETAHFLDS